MQYDESTRKTITEGEVWTLVVVNKHNYIHVGMVTSKYQKIFEIICVVFMV